MEIKGFRLAKAIASSSQFVTYRAIRIADGMPVIVKTPNQEHPSERQIARLKHEYQITTKLNHPGVGKAYSLEPLNESIALILEDTKSNTLHYYLDDQKPISITSFFKISIQLSDILGSIHKQQIIHKGIRPHSILWDPILNEVKLIDFGISTQLSQESQELNFSSILEGSLPYISPEQTGRMNRKLDYRTDYYSLGITFYEILTGKLPFQAQDVMGWLHNHIAKIPSDPATLNAAIPHSLIQIVMKLMSKDPGDRYQGTYGLIKDLKECQKQWSGKNSDDNFILGRWDISEKFNIPKKLLDRENELLILKEQYRQTAKGNSGLAIISGPSGIGKTTLIKEFSKSFIQNKGLFIEGRLESFQQDTPYNALSNIFSDLVGQLLTESSEKIQYWKSKILKALGPNSQLILTMAPELEKIMGPQPPVQELNPTEAQNRLIFTFFKFINVFTRKDHPLAIFIDDFQWCDQSSFTLIESLATSQEYQYILLILSIRSDHADEITPLLEPIENIEKNNLIISHFHLNPLKERSVNELIARTLQKNPDDCTELTKLIYRKTEGNPFYIIELLKDLYQSEVIYFQSEEGAWDWDMDKIQQTAVCNNVVDLMIKELNQLKPDTMQFLTYAACIGNSFDLQILSTLTGRSRIDSNNILWDAVKKQIIIPLSDNYQLIHADSEDQFKSSAENKNILKVTYRFQNGRVQQTLYNKIEPHKKKKIHLAIGQFLFESSQENEKDEQFSQIVKHLNEGRSLIRNEPDKENLVRINLKAAKLAREASAYKAALKYIEIAKDSLPDNAWKKCSELALAVHREYAQVTYLCGKFDIAELHIKLILQHTENLRDQIEIFLMQIVQFAVMGKEEEAIQIGLKSLTKMGIRISNRPGSTLILKELLKVQWNMRGRSISSLINAPELKEPNKKLIAKLLVELCGPVYNIGDDKLLALIILKLVNLSLLHGNSPEAAYAFTVFGSFLIGLFGNLKKGIEFGKVGMALIEKYQDLLLKSRCIYIHAVFSLHWYEHPSKLTPLLLEGIEAGFQSGDLFYLGYLSQHTIIWDPRLTIHEILEEINEKYLPLAETTQNQDSIHMLTILRQLYSNYSGLTDEPFSLNGPSFKEEPFLKDIQNKDSRLLLAFYYGAKAEIFFLLEDYESTIRCVKEIDRVITKMTITPYRVRFSVMAFFSFSACYTMMNSKRKKTALKRMNEEFIKMKKWANQTPDNFQHLLLAMQAEKSRIYGDYKKAARYFENAAQKAEKNGFIRDNALINELAAKFYLDEEQETIADTYLQKSYQIYKQWGSSAKLKQLEQKYPHLIHATTKFNQVPNHISSKSQSIGIQHTELSDLKFDSNRNIITNLDLDSILKASKTLSSEIILPELLKKIMEIVMENAGAQNGILLLERDEAFFIEAATSIDSKGINDLRSKPIERIDHSDHLLPSSVIHYVIHTKEALILNDPKNDSTFSNNLYIIRKQPKSIICLPLVHQNKLNALLYLENNLISEAFTPERVEILQHLCSYAAISIENARLYGLLGTSEKKYRNIVENATEGIFQTSLEGKVITCNNALAEMLGYSSTEELKSSITNIGEDLFVDASKRQELIEVLYKKEKVENFEYDGYKKDKTITNASINAHLVRDSAGNIKFIEGIISDITQKKQFEEMEIARKKADAENVAKSDFLANMSHEIRTPMNTILGISDLLDKTSLNEKQKDFVQMLKVSGQTLFDLINDILDFSKIESGQIDLESIGYSLSEQLEMIATIFTTRAEEKRLKFSVHLNSSISPHRLGDPMRLRQILINLIGNSIKFTQMGHIKVEINPDPSSNDPDSILFSVEDTGIGISDDNQQIIFDSFSQAEAATTRNYGGTGLGLAISKKLVELLGGKIWIESELEKGTKFYFTLRTPELKTLPTITNPSDDNLKGVRVLISGSDQITRYTYRNFLDFYGIKLKEGNNKRFILGELNRAEMRGTPIHILLIDLDSSDYSGTEIIQLIDKLDLLKPPSLLFMFSRPDQLTNLKPDNLHIIDTLKKPLKDGKALIRAIQTLLVKNPMGISPPKNQEEKSSAPVKPINVLLAEDIESNRKIIEFYFEDTNVQLDLAFNGEEAISKFIERDYDIVFMDIQMPVMDGIEATRSIRKWEAETDRKATPIVALTAHAVEHQRQKCLKAGCTDFISKPVLRKELWEVLDNLTIERSDHESSKIQEKTKAPPKSEIVKLKNVHLVIIDSFLKELIPDFFKEIKVALENMKVALEDNDFSTLKRLGHGYRGASINYGFQELSTLLRQLELATEQKESNVAKTCLKKISDYIQSVTVEYSNQ